MNEKIINTLKTLLETLVKAKAEGNNKSISKTTRRLNAISHENPEEAKEVGWTPTEEPTHNRVFKFALIGPPKSENDTHAQQIMYRTSYWNQLVEAFKPVYSQILSLAGPKELEYRSFDARIEAQTEVIKAIVADYYQSEVDYELSEHAAFVAAKKVRTDLYAERNALIPDVIAERKASGYLKIVTEILKSFSATDVKEIRGRNGSKGMGRGMGIYQGNYLPTEAEFKNATDALCKDINVHRCTVDFRRINDQGTLSIQTGNSVNDQPIETVFNGENTRFQIGEITPEFTAMFNLKNVKPTWKLVKIRTQSTVQGANPVWAYAIAIIHRPLPEDCDLTHAEVKISGSRARREYSLHVGIREAIPEPCGTEQAMVRFAKGEGFGSYSRTNDAEMKAKLEVKGYSWLEDGVITENTEYKDSAVMLANLRKYVKMTTGVLSKRVLNSISPMPAVLSTMSVPTDNVSKSWMLAAWNIWSRSLDYTLVKGLKKEAFQLFKTMRGANKQSTQGYLVPLSERLAVIVATTLNLSEHDALVFALLLVFEMRYAHLNRWIANLQDNMQARRKDEQRNFAVALLKNTKVLTIEKESFRARFISGDQASVGKSDLESVLSQTATKMGVKVMEVKLKKEPKAKAA